MHRPSRPSRSGVIPAHWPTPVPERGPPDYDESSARRDHQASAAVIALSAWSMSPTILRWRRGPRV